MVLEIINLIVTLYLIYEIRQINIEKQPRIIMKNNDGGFTKPSSKKSKTNYEKDRSKLNTKEEIVTYLEEENKKYQHIFGSDYNKKRIKNIEKAFDKPESTEEITYHGGCIGCKSQSLHGIGRCRDCRYFLPDWTKDNLFIE